MLLFQFYAPICFDDMKKTAAAYRIVSSIQRAGGVSPFEEVNLFKTGIATIYLAEQSENKRQPTPFSSFPETFGVQTIRIHCADLRTVMSGVTQLVA